jgi:hypothetical protein
LPQFNLLYDVLEIVQPFTIFESGGKLSELISFLEEEDQPVDGGPGLCELQQLFSLALGLEPVSRLLLGLLSLIVAYDLVQSLYF